MMNGKSDYEELKKEVIALENLLDEKIADEKRLKKGLHLYQTLFDHAGVGIMIIDIGTQKVVNCNQKAFEELGYTREEYLNLDHEDYLLDSHTQKVRIMSRLMEDGAVTYTSRLRKKNGDVIDVIGSAVVVTLSGKKYNHLIRINITDQIRLNQKLKESEEKFRNIIESMEEGYFETDLAGTITFCNRAAIKIYGLVPEDLIGRNFKDNMTKDTAQKVFAYFNHIFTNGEQPGTIEYEIFRKDGSVIILETSVSLMKNDAERIVGFRGIARDVTEKKKLEKALKESEELYRILFEHAGFAIILTDARTGMKKAFNKKAYQQLGYTLKEYEKMSSEAFAVSRQDFVSLVKEMLEKGSHKGYLQLRTKDGEIRDFYRSTIKVKIEGKTHLHGIRIDVTDQKKAEQALRESEARFRSIFETAPDPIFICDVFNRTIMDVNRAGCACLGYAKEELLTMSMADLTAPENVMDTERLLEALNKNSMDFYESVHLTKTGEKIFVEISSRLVTQGGNQVILSIIRDVTQRKRAEEELAGHRTHLEALVQERTEKLNAAQNELIKQEKLSILGQLTATVSHELRNPLGVIQSSNYYLQKKISSPDEKIQKHLKRIDDQVVICDSIVADLMEYNRAPYPESMKGNILSWLPPLLGRISGSEKIRITRKIPPDLPEIHHDKVKIQRVIINIMDNAIWAVRVREEHCRNRGIAYTPEIAIMVRAMADGIVMEIKDNGMGMDKQTRDLAFDPLFTTRVRGTGLGLANVEKIMVEHGGKVTLSSVPGQGTTITLFLPFKEVK